MLTASELRPGVALRIEGTLYKVLAAEYHAGGGKMGGVTHAKLRNLETGTLREWRFRADETVAEIEPERQLLQYLYSDEAMGYFMHPRTFEQIAIERARLGRASEYLREGMSVAVEFYEGRPVALDFPAIVEMRVADTAPPSHVQGTMNVWKEARLENGLLIRVPPFLAPGEMVRVQVETGEYVERAKQERARTHP
jgi:elongation factor P